MKVKKMNKSLKVFLPVSAHPQGKGFLKLQPVSADATDRQGTVVYVAQAGRYMLLGTDCFLSARDAQRRMLAKRISAASLASRKLQTIYSRSK